MSVVDLTIIVVQNAFSLVRKVWFVVSGLSHDDQGVVSHASTLSSMHECSLFVIGLPNDDSARVSSVPKDEGVLFAVACDKGAATELTVELGLLLQLALDSQESGNSGFLNIPEKRSAGVTLSVGVVFAGVMAFVLAVSELVVVLLWFSRPLDSFLVVLEVLRHVLSNVLRDKVAVCPMAVSDCYKPFLLALRRFHRLTCSLGLPYHLGDKYRVLIDLGAPGPPHITSHGTLTHLLHRDVSSHFLGMRTSML